MIQDERPDRQGAGLGQPRPHSAGGARPRGDEWKLTGRSWRTSKAQSEGKGRPGDPWMEIAGKVGAGELTPEKALERIRDPATWPGPERAGRQPIDLRGLVGILDRGDRDVAGPIFDEERRLLEDLPALNRAVRLRSLAVAQGRLGLVREAIATASSIDPSTFPDEASGIRPHCSKALAFLRIAEHQVKAGDKAGAATTARRVLEVVDLIQQESYRGHPLEPVGRTPDRRRGHRRGAPRAVATSSIPTGVFHPPIGRRGAGRPG